MSKRGFWIEVSGEYACFTRPEMKVERVSYDVITPSSARAIFEAILWKPAISWQIRRIEVMNPIRWFSVRRNEIGKVASARSDGLFIEDERQQRASLLLRDVRYRLHGEFVFIPPDERKAGNYPVPEWLVQMDAEDHADYLDIGKGERKDETEAKYAAMFERRAKKGQCFCMPYLGCREFAAHVRLITDYASEAEKPLDETRDLGWMLYDMDFSDPNNIRPLFYRARLEQGTIDVPNREDTEQVRG